MNFKSIQSPQIHPQHILPLSGDSPGLSWSLISCLSENSQRLCTRDKLRSAPHEPHRSGSSKRPLSIMASKVCRHDTHSKNPILMSGMIGLHRMTMPRIRMSWSISVHRKRLGCTLSQTSGQGGGGAGTPDSTVTSSHSSGVFPIKHRGAERCRVT